MKDVYDSDLLTGDMCVRRLESPLVIYLYLGMSYAKPQGLTYSCWSVRWFVRNGHVVRLWHEQQAGRKAFTPLREGVQ